MNLTIETVCPNIKTKEDKSNSFMFFKITWMLQEMKYGWYFFSSADLESGWGVKLLRTHGKNLYVGKPQAKRSFYILYNPEFLSGVLLFFKIISVLAIQKTRATRHFKAEV